ncbi:copper transporter [Phytoactinopolyspora halotolerans]|uniref:Copper transporter n=1 Tax=Phytoactinopolyspora halotolerans TaxID=1981512 RepID=A0A6L9SJ21_9ACTN|nr:copper transporter [Phytoactinopolyspora halotolerans]NEE04688.1 copper transporter [Phytoactinopolyspora halotolerans]
MIDFRYHLVSIIAIFFALATGIVLGAGPLSETIDDNLTEQTANLREENRELHEALESASEDQQYQEAFVQDVMPRLVSGQLQDQRVAVIALPGAEEEAVEQVRETLERAGAQAELVVRIDPSWTDPDSEPVLDELAAELVASGTELEAGNGFDRGAAVLASALLSQPVEGGDTGIDDPAQTVNTTVVTAYQDAGLVQLEHDASTAPTLAVAVAGPVSGEDAEDRLGRLVTLIAQMHTASNGLVVAGPSSTAEGGVLTAVRGSEATESVSTVDVADLPTGRVAVVFALTEQQRGDAGHYGLVGEIDGALPPVPEETEPEDEDGGIEDGETGDESGDGSGAGNDSTDGADSAEGAESTEGGDSAEGAEGTEDGSAQGGDE